MTIYHTKTVFIPKSVKAQAEEERDNTLIQNVLVPFLFFVVFFLLITLLCTHIYFDKKVHSLQREKTEIENTLQEQIMSHGRRRL